MKKSILTVPLLGFLLLILSSCSAVGEKASSVSVVYCVTAVFSVFIFLIYMFGIKRKNAWFILLFTSVFIVNIGYFSLAVSKGLEEALLANRISYLGSVFLPMSMLMIILDSLKVKYGKWLPGLLTGIGIVVFLIAASPGYLDVYYKEVSFISVGGVGMLQKVYGPLHIIYLFYLLAYFFAMTSFIIVKAAKKKIESVVHTVILLSAVFVNIAVWLLEQIVRIDFEILSVSYVITVLFLVCLCFLMQETEKQKLRAETAEKPTVPEKPVLEEPADREEAVPEAVFITKTDDTDDSLFDEGCSAGYFETPEYKNFMYGLGLLTNTEQKIYNCYIEGRTTKEILSLLDITDNTLKYHNKNIYSKLGVSSRKQLKEIAYKITNSSDK